MRVCVRERERDVRSNKHSFQIYTRLISEPLLASISFGPFSRLHPFFVLNDGKKVQVCKKVCYQLKFGFIRNYPFSFCKGGDGSVKVKFSRRL